MDPQSKPLGVVSSTSYYIHTQTILSRKSGTVFPYDESLIHLPVHVYCSHHPGYKCVSSLSPGFPFYPAHIHPSNPTLCSSQTELLKKKNKADISPLPKSFNGFSSMFGWNPNSFWAMRFDRIWPLNISSGPPHPILYEENFQTGSRTNKTAL